MKNTFLFLLLFISVGAFAQQGLNLKLLEVDSTQIEMEKQNDYHRLISGVPESTFLMEKIDLSDFNFSEEFTKRSSLNFDFYSFKNLPVFGFSTGMINPMNSPFYQNGMVLSEGAYQLDSKLVLGGYSYGINPMFSAPLPNNGMGNFDRYGSTMFLQYKVSKNFKIETRVNVSQGGMHPGF